MRTISKRTLIALAILGVGAGIWIWQWRVMGERARATEAMRQQLASLEKEARDAELDLEKAKNEAENEKKGVVAAWHLEAKSRSDLAQLDPDARWSLPPSGTPEWDTNSPYAWLPKDQLTNFGLKVFRADGRLTDEAASTFAINGEALKKLNGELAQHVSDFQSMELAGVVRTDGQMDGLPTNGQMVVLHINAMPDQGNQFVAEVQSSLESELGEQRTDLIMQLGQSWLAEFGKDEKTYGVTRMKDGSLHIRVNTGQSNMSTELFPDDVASLSRYIPSYLVPEILDALGNESAQTQ